MAKDIETIKQEIETKIRENCIGKFYSDYNIGITKDPEKRVFNDHNVDRSKCHWIFKAENKQVVSDIESHFIKKGMKGGVGGKIDDDCVFVYVYRITEHTIEAPKLEIIEESSKTKTVEVYSGKSDYADRFFKIRVIGQYQLDGFGFDLDAAIKLAEKEVEKIEGQLIVSNPEGKL